MSANDEEGKGVCILSFDSGGPGTYSQLLILKEFMSRLANDLSCAEDEIYPADHFDLVGGVGFGGFVAIILGLLKMNVSQAIDALVSLASMIFPEASNAPIDRGANSKILRQVVEDTLQAREIPLDSKMNDKLNGITRCKVVLYAATSDNINHPQAFRTYPTRGASLNPTIVEAVCATMAIPSHFVPVRIGVRRDQRHFVGGPLGAKNPTLELLREAGNVFGNERRVAQIISIGCGVPAILSLTAITSESGESRLLKEIPTECQKLAEELSRRFFNFHEYLRLSVAQGMERVEMDDWSVLGNIAAHTKSYLEMEVVTRALDALLRLLKRDGGLVTLGQLNLSNSMKVAAKTAPLVTPYFVLRNKEWEKLVWHLVTSHCSRQRILPITGMGGCGKTQLVSYFLQEYPSLHVAYVDASTLSSIKADLQEWSRALGEGHARDVWEDAVRILSSSSEDERLGLILDNADDPTLNLAPFIPKSVNLTIVITSRNRNLGNLSTTAHIELGEMEAETALEALLRAARCQPPLPAKELKSAHTLLKELGCLAVALVQAGTYCHELSISFTQYLSLFKSHRADLMKRAEPSSLDNYERGAYTTLDISYTALPQPAREFLHFISFFHHTDIPLAALATSADCGSEEEWLLLPRPDNHTMILADLRRLLCPDGHWSQIQLQDTLRTLRSFSLLSITSVGETIFLQLHPLVQSWSRDMDPSTSQHCRSMVAQIITSCCRDETFQLYRHLIPHVLDILSQPKSEELHINDLMAAGEVLQKQGHSQAAAGVFETALEVIKKTSEPRMESVVSAWLAEVYRYQGQWSKAEKLQVKMLEKMRRILGMEHPDVSPLAGNLALTYYAQGRWSEAEKLEVQVLEQRLRVLGMEHPDTIQAAANLASTYQAQSRWSESEKLGVAALERQRRVLGREHPDTIRTAGGVASTYRHQGRWNEAEKLEVEVLEQMRRILGNEHPDTILAAVNLAATYGKQGRCEEHAALLAPAVQLGLKVLGQQHPDTQGYLRDLVFVYEELGKEKEAQETRDLLTY